MSRILKKLGFGILYVVYLVLFILLVDYVFFYRPKLAQLRVSRSHEMTGTRNPETEPLATVQHVDDELLKLLGKANGRKQSSFWRYPKEKRPGVVRICSYGDSYAEGDEVDDTYDYPRQLQNLFASHGAGNVEAVNFGISAFGFQQSYMMWDFVARHFDCDVHLFGPRGFQPLRDTTFGALYHWSPYYLHARYVLEDGDARLIEILGDTYKERFDEHFSFIPSWRYWRYTRRVPMFVKALIPKGRDIENPFYYDRRDMLEEASELQRILLAKMAREAGPILVGHHRADVVANVNAVDAGNLSAAQLPELIDFPYLARYSHAGPMGNHLAAQLFFTQLTGRRQPIQVLETTDLDWGEHGDGPGKRRSLESYTKIDFEIAGVTVGELYTIGWVAKALKVDALVSLHSPEESVLDSCFFPMDLELQPGMAVTLRRRRESETKDFSLGELTVVRGGLNIGLIEAEGFALLTFKEFEHKKDRGEPSPLTHGKRRARGFFFTGSAAAPLDELRDSEVTILVNGQDALKGTHGKVVDTEGIWFYPALHHFRVPRAAPFGIVDPAVLPASGEVELVAEHWQDGEVRIPIARWHRRTLEPPAVERPLRQLLRITDDGRAVLEEVPR